MTIDMSKYLGLFVSESTEHLEQLGRDLVALEKDPSPEKIDSMFRHAHSVKGMASSMGFEPIAVLAHRVEDLVDGVRSDRSLINRELIDLLLASTDQMLSQVRSANAGAPVDESGPLLDQLSAKVASLMGRAPEPTRVAKAIVTPPTHEPAPVIAAVPAPKSDSSLGLPPRYAMKLKIASTCQVPGVRAFLVHKKLSGLGNIFDLKPALEDLKAGRIPDGQMALELESSAGEAAIAQALKTVSEVEIALMKPVVPVAAPPPPPAPAAPETSKVVGFEPARTVRVRTELLDYFLDSAGELLLATARLREIGKVLPAQARGPLEEGVDRLHALVKDLHGKVMGARMTPLSVITDRLPRAARDIARKRERDVELVISGAEIELDRAIIDDLADPLLHLLRNCIDHGIEAPAERTALGKNTKGRVAVTVRRQRDRVVIEIEDDGRGMDAAKLKASAVARGLVTQEAAARMTDREAFLLSCLPGVSTAKDVSDISGRGVGMDAVKRTVDNVGGTLEIESELGRGTRFTLRLPLTVAVVNLLLVQVQSEIVGLPIGKVLGAMEADASKISGSRGALMINAGNGLLPVHSLDALLGFGAAANVGASPYVVMEGDAGRVALRVDRLLGQEEVVLKALSRPLDLVPGLSGVTILGSGRPIFILDVPRLLAS